MHIVTALGHALWMAFTMFWQIFWGLSLGFLFSAVIEVMVSKSEMSKLLPDSFRLRCQQADERRW